MRLLPIKEKLEDNKELTINSSYKLTVEATIVFYKKVGFAPPWIGYFVEDAGNVVGSAGFKGPPNNGVIEIAYGTVEEYRKQGIGTAICRQLVDLSLQTNSSIKITAKTFLRDNFSARILAKNNFVCTGAVVDPEDGEVWEWVYKKTVGEAEG